jgi:hypothetical protein
VACPYSEYAVTVLGKAKKEQTTVPYLIGDRRSLENYMPEGAVSL